MHARTHQKSSVLRADTANLRIEEVASVNLYPTWELRKLHVPIFTKYFKSQKLATIH